jgi:hypothetical protein
MSANSAMAKTKGMRAEESAHMKIRTDGSFVVDKSLFILSKEFNRQLNAARSLADSIILVSKKR